MLVTERHWLGTGDGSIRDIRRPLNLNTRPQHRGSGKDARIDRGPRYYVSAAMENLHSIRFFLQRELARPRIIIKELQNVFLKLEIIAACGDLKMIFPVLNKNLFGRAFLHVVVASSRHAI